MSKETVYIAVVGSETENGQCRDSIENIKRRTGDTPPQYIRATKGFEARQMHLDYWYNNTKHPYILFLDHDMIFPADTLGRLRSHGLPYVSGFYMRRTFNPVAPVWFEDTPSGQMPMKPFMAILEKDKLYPIGASGWGCVMIHRDVITAVKPLLKGEPEIIEDDMDVLPYDAHRILRAIQDAKQSKNPKEMLAFLTEIEQEFVPLRMVKDNVGSDIRFPFFAKLAGIQLYGDTGVSCGHMLNYPVTFDDYTNQPASRIRDVSLAINDSHNKEIERLRKAREL